MSKASFLGSVSEVCRFIADKMRDPEAGEPLLRAALKIDPQNDVAALHLGVIALRYKRNFTEAVEYFRDVLGINTWNICVLMYCDQHFIVS